MSKEAAIAFLKKVAEDPALQRKIVALAKEQGYDFTVDELTEDELGSVTGGAVDAFLKLGGIKFASPQLGDIKFSPSLGNVKIKGELDGL
jgi:predicted ribosomally synthesized peptide with nif11-like leader